MNTSYVSIIALVLGAFCASGASGNVYVVCETGSGEVESEVTSVRGEILGITVRSGPAPAVGDSVTVMDLPDEDGNAVSIGEWRVTAVRGGVVEATLVRGHGFQPLEGMHAFFRSASSPGLKEEPDVTVPGNASSGVPGEVIEVRGEEVTIRLDRPAAPAVGDRVEISYTFGEDTISVGTWRVIEVRPDGRVDADTEDARGQPSPRMDALVFATGPKSESK